MQVCPYLPPVAKQRCLGYHLCPLHHRRKASSPAVLSKNTPPILPDLSMRHLRREHPHRLLSQGDRSLETSNRQETMDWLDPAWFSSGRSSRSNRLVLQKQSHLLSTFLGNRVCVIVHDAAHGLLAGKTTFTEMDFLVNERNLLHFMPSIPCALGKSLGKAIRIAILA